MEEYTPKKFKDVLPMLMEDRLDDRFPTWDEMGPELVNEILEVWLDHAARGFSFSEICQRRQKLGKSILSPQVISNMVKVAASWNRTDVATQSDVILAKLDLMERRLFEEMERIDGLVAESSGYGVPVIKIEKDDKGAETKRTVTYEQPTRDIVSITNAMSKLMQIRVVASGVQKRVAEVTAPPSIKIDLPDFNNRVFTTRPTIDVTHVENPKLPTNGTNGASNGSSNGNHGGNGTNGSGG